MLYPLLLTVVKIDFCNIDFFHFPNYFNKKKVNLANVRQGNEHFHHLRADESTGGWDINSFEVRKRLQTATVTKTLLSNVLTVNMFPVNLLLFKQCLWAEEKSTKKPCISETTF